MIVGVGVDLCAVDRIRRALEGPGGTRFRARVFTDGERAYCEARKASRFESYAARFAAKEAALKALGTGWADGIGWHDVEVVRGTTGPPTLVLHGAAARHARARRVGRWLLSLAHDGGQAVAWVVAEGGRVSGRGARAAPPRPAGRGRSPARPRGSHR